MPLQDAHQYKQSISLPDVTSSSSGLLVEASKESASTANSFKSQNTQKTLTCPLTKNEKGIF